MISAPSAVLAFHAPRSLPEAYLVALDVAALVIGIVLVVTSYIPVRRRAA